MKILSNCVTTNVGRTVIVVSGGCPRGADRFAEQAAHVLGLEMLIHPVVKLGDAPVAHKGDFRRRAFERNGLIARDSDVLFALVSPCRTGGTEDTVSKALELGKRVFIVDDAGLLFAQEPVRRVF